MTVELFPSKITLVRQPGVISSKRYNNRSCSSQYNENDLTGPKPFILKHSKAFSARIDGKYEIRPRIFSDNISIKCPFISISINRSYENESWQINKFSDLKRKKKKNH